MPASDEILLRATLELASQGRDTCAPNPPVGCLIVRDGEIIGRGFHAYAGQGHAEVQALADAQGEIAGATVYVSLEPCAFVGRTPACAQTLIDAKVARVVCAAVDPHPKVQGQGLAMLEAAGIATAVIELPEALEMIRGYRACILRGRPWVTLKTASSIDGAVALADGQSQWITGSEARQDVQRLRARSDAILTGIGTILADDPRLTARVSTPCKAPLRVVLDSHGRTPIDAQIVTDEYATLVVHESKVSLVRGGVEQFVHDPRDLEGVLLELAQRECSEVLVEAGPKVVGSFLAQHLWDEWIAYIAPMALGSASQHVADFELRELAAAHRADIKSIDQIGADLRLTLLPRHE